MKRKKNVNKYAVRSDLATHKFILILKHAMFDCYRIYAKKKLEFGVPQSNLF